jgi:hypothetical protein
METGKEKMSITEATQNVRAAIKQLHTTLKESDKAQRIAALEAEDGTVPELGAISETVTAQIIALIKDAMSLFEHFGDTFQPVERTRLISAGIRNFGFIETAYNSAEAHPELIPSYLPVPKFKDIISDFKRKQSIIGYLQQFDKSVADGMLASSDVAYHDALEYYDYLREAARRKVAGAETEYKLLSPFFHRAKHDVLAGDTPKLG